MLRVGKIPWRRKWKPVFLPGEFHGQRSLVGYNPQDHKESDTTEQLSMHSCITRYVNVFRFFSFIGYYKILSRELCAMQQAFVGYLFYIQQYVYINSSPQPFIQVDGQCYLIREPFPEHLYQQKPVHYHHLSVSLSWSSLCSAALATWKHAIHIIQSQFITLECELYTDQDCLFIFCYAQNSD